MLCWNAPPWLYASKTRCSCWIGSLPTPGLPSWTSASSSDWDPGEAFRRGFIQGYWGDGEGHEAAFAAAATLDLVNLVDLLVRSPPGSQREKDVEAQIEATLQRG